MLRSIELRNVGPAAGMRMEFADRLNVVTGDNGLGKTFLLDVAWWALTRTWVGRPAIPGIVLYLRIDGGFSVWDPARNYWRKDTPDRPAAYHFDNRQIWEGLRAGGVSVCEGIERDWVSWQKGSEPQFDVLKAVLENLSPPNQPLKPGPPTRVFVGEGFDRPTLKFGNEIIPVVMASAGVRRILALAYLLVWAWHEHRVAAKLLRKSPESRLTVLIDEPETHLHPSWQRRIVPALLDAVANLPDGHTPLTQMLIATHAPMVLASLEPVFDEEADGLFHLRLREGVVSLARQAWAKQGDATNWLVSEVFGLEQARSLHAERAVKAAEAFMRGEKAELGGKQQIDAELRRVLAGHDPFWPRWVVFAEKANGKRR